MTGAAEPLIISRSQLSVLQNPIGFIESSIDPIDFILKPLRPSMKKVSVKISSQLVKALLQFTVTALLGEVQETIVGGTLQRSI